MDRSIVEKLSLDTLEELSKQLVVNNNIIEEEILKRKRITSSNDKIQYFELMRHFKYRDFIYLVRSCQVETGNNSCGSLDPYVLVMDNPEFKEIAKTYNINNKFDLHTFILSNSSSSKEFMNINEIKQALIEVEYLSYLDNFFNKEENVLGYEGAYTTLNYIKNHFLCSSLKDVSLEENIKRVFLDFDEKKEIVKENFIEIAQELLAERNKNPNSRISVYNKALSRAAKKEKGTQISRAQEYFIECIAFGHTIEDLKNKDYSKAKQLIFLPTKK